MSRKITVRSYLSSGETVRPQELTFGVLREPPAPGICHQLVVGRLHLRLALHVRRQRIGRVLLAPIDVILDRERALVVQPDVVFVSNARLDICRDRIWGAPDLVIEVLSGTNRRHDRITKVGWYRAYGVRECWLVDPQTSLIEVADLQPGCRSSRVYPRREIIRSTVLPRLRLRPEDVCRD
jgi:Uma2 family endonuclease